MAGEVVVITYDVYPSNAIGTIKLQVTHGKFGACARPPNLTPALTTSRRVKMSDFLNQGAAQFAPMAGDPIPELRWKAESMLEYLRENEAFLRKFPTGAVDERLALWQPLANLLAQAMANQNLAEDARLEAHRVWAEEMHLSALITVTMCVHARGANAQKRFADNPEHLQELIDMLELGRPAALRVLSKEDLNELRKSGFLREGE